MRFLYLTIASAFLFYTWSSKPNTNLSNETRNKQLIVIQPLDSFDNSQLESLKKNLSEFWQKKVLVLQAQLLPCQFCHPAIESYSSDSILSFLATLRMRGYKNVVGITHKNVYSIKNRNGPGVPYFDIGIFGAGDEPGHCCIVSDYKLGGVTESEYDNAMLNIIDHELGHNYGLAHCANDACIMSEKKGFKIALIKSKLDFCTRCRSKL